MNVTRLERYRTILFPGGVRKVVSGEDEKLAQVCFLESYRAKVKELNIRNLWSYMISPQKVLREAE